MFRCGIVADEADVVHQRVEPDVGDVVGIEGQLDAPAEARFRARDAEVAAQFLDGVEQLGLAEVGHDAVGMALRR